MHYIEKKNTCTLLQVHWGKRKNPHPQKNLIAVNITMIWKKIMKMQYMEKKYLYIITSIMREKKKTPPPKKYHGCKDHYDMNKK